MQDAGLPTGSDIDILLGRTACGNDIRTASSVHGPPDCYLLTCSRAELRVVSLITVISDSSYGVGEAISFKQTVSTGHKSRSGHTLWPLDTEASAPQSPLPRNVRCSMGQPSD